MDSGTPTYVIVNVKGIGNGSRALVATINFCNYILVTVAIPVAGCLFQSCSKATQVEKIVVEKTVAVDTNFTSGTLVLKSSVICTRRIQLLCCFYALSTTTLWNATNRQ